MRQARRRGQIVDPFEPDRMVMAQVWRDRMFTGEVLELEVPGSGYWRRYEHVVHCRIRERRFGSPWGYLNDCPGHATHHPTSFHCRGGIREDDPVDEHRRSMMGPLAPYRAMALYEVLWFQHTVGLTRHHEMQLHWKEYE